jgi:CheY-like chemotaxis protein
MSIRTTSMSRSPFNKSTASWPNGESRLRVLVVEDDAINSQILQKRLRMDKHIAIPVTNGQEAVDLLKGDRDIDVVLMDIQ